MDLIQLSPEGRELSDLLPSAGRLVLGITGEVPPHQCRVGVKFPPDGAEAA